MNEDLLKISRLVRRDILHMSYEAKSAHVGGALSCVEVLVALYFRVLHNNPDNPNDPKRDRFVLSKAHDAKALYSVLARRGYFSLKFLEGYEKNGGKLPGHSTRHCVPGVEASAGSLGHGLSIATGMALSGKLRKEKHRVFALLSDGECDEGSTWEAALFSGHHKLSNLVAVVDYNKLQGYGYTKDVLDLEPFARKWQSFGWEAKGIGDGHNYREILEGFSKLPLKTGKPSVFIVHTVKGKGGVPRHINQISSQYKPPTKEELDALAREEVI